MSAIIDIGNIPPSLPPVRSPAAAPDDRRSAPSSPPPPPDTVELSRFGRALARAAETSSFRIAQIRSIRAEIESGVYETPQRIEGTITRLLDILA